MTLLLFGAPVEPHEPELDALHRAAHVPTLNYQRIEPIRTTAHVGSLVSQHDVDLAAVQGEGHVVSLINQHHPNLGSIQGEGHLGSLINEHHPGLGEHQWIETFTGVNGTALIGSTAANGATYTGNGTWVISSNAAWCSTNAAYQCLVADWGVADVDITVTHVTAPTTASTNGIALRWVDASNFIRMVVYNGYRYLQIYKAGVLTTWKQIAAAQPAGTKTRIVVTGNRYTLYADGVEIGAYVDAGNNFTTSTLHGLQSHHTGAATHLLDNLTVYDATGTPLHSHGHAVPFNHAPILTALQSQGYALKVRRRPPHISPTPYSAPPRSLGQYQFGFRFDLLSKTLDLMGQLETMTAGSIKVTTSGTVKRTLDGVQLTAAELRDIDPFSDRVRPMWLYGTGEAFPLGVFLFTTVSEQVRSGMSLYDVSLSDQGFLLDQPATHAYSVPPGGSILGLLDRIMDDSSIPHSRRRVLAGVDQTTLDPIVWQAGTSKAKIADEACELAGWLPLYFDNQGVCTLRQIPDLWSDPIDRAYPLDETSKVRANSIGRGSDLFSAPNVFQVRSNGSTAAGEIIGRVQVDPQLPWSVEKRGFEIVNDYQVQGVTSTAQAQAVAAQRALLNVVYENVEFDSLPNPLHDIYQLVSLGESRYWETGWTLALKPPWNMHHTLTSGGFTSG